MKNKTRRWIAWGIAVMMLAFLPVGPAAVNTYASEGRQTASAILDQEENCVDVTIDLTGGWSVEFARGAFYLYDQEIVDGLECYAMGLTLDQEVYEEYIERGRAAESFAEADGVISYIDDNLEQLDLCTVGEDAFFLLSVKPDLDGEEALSRVQLKRGV